MLYQVLKIIACFSVCISSQHVVLKLDIMLTLYCSELSFRKGDYLYLLRQVDKNWFLGERHGIDGIFPVSYVEVCVCVNGKFL